jgi:hypothetical protein
MKSKLLGLIACMALISVSQASAAILVGTTTDASGIDGLVVDGVTYDVTFVNASYDTVYPSGSPPTFLNNLSGASDAASNLAAALNTLSVSVLSGASKPFALIPYYDAAGYDTAADASCGVYPLYACSPPALNESWSFGNGFANDAVVYDTDFAIFVPTPLPAALPLFGAVLGVGGLLGWHRKRQNAAGALAAA